MFLLNTVFVRNLNHSAMLKISAFTSSKTIHFLSSILKVEMVLNWCNLTCFPNKVKAATLKRDIKRVNNVKREAEIRV